MSPQERAVEALKLLSSKTAGVLCTHSERMEGFPYGSFAPFALTASHEPVFFFSGLAIHTKNLAHSNKASLLVSENELTGGRVNLFGEVKPVSDEAEIASMREAYLAAHPDSQQWIDFGDFQFYRLHIANIYWVGGFGEMGWISRDVFAAL